MSSEELKQFLDEKVDKYNNPNFIDLDPIQIPHRFSLKEDIEISGFLASTIAWGKRAMIIKSADKIMSFMGHSPYDFIMEHTQDHLASIDGSIHRTFNAVDLKYFFKSLQNIYQHYGGLEKVFAKHATEDSLQSAIHEFKSLFFELSHEQRSIKHIGDPYAGSAAKKVNMFLRWMVRNDGKGVDFGIWKTINPSVLSCPLDVHSGNVARKLGILQRKQNDAKAVAELDAGLRIMDVDDPVKYDFALFGLGVDENF